MRGEMGWAHAMNSRRDRCSAATAWMLTSLAPWSNSGLSSATTSPSTKSLRKGFVHSLQGPSRRPDRVPGRRLFFALVLRHPRAELPDSLQTVSRGGASLWTTELSNRTVGGGASTRRTQTCKDAGS